MSGKGSKPRPLAIDAMEYAMKWDAIFGKKRGLHAERVLDEELQEALAEEADVKSALENALNKVYN